MDQRTRLPDPSPIGLWDEMWKGRDAPSHCSPVFAVIAKQLGSRLRGARVLEIGAGSGRDIVELAAAGAVAYANDLSAFARAKIAALAERRNVKVAVDSSDLRSLPYPDDFFDVVYSQGVVEHFKDVDVVIAEQRRLCRPKTGVLLIDVPQTFNPYTVYKHLRMWMHTWPPGWESQFSPARLRSLVRKQKLDVIKMYSWGEHGEKMKPLLQPLDRWAWTATCVGVICKRPD
ncbi:MAG: class I SAM-dependent methyltransferase [Candidatus Eremiobacteraeota bacterium]|nr:class I SAM-dependent methyltransferase [Candidatus Eremiobacteraeota bacterium]MBC5828335.1 class I SAM-dependent methyltransferase [Candidatus Eremiobacteraeota bacterium]